MAREINKTTSKPTGLEIKRKGNEITFSWKKVAANHGDGQMVNVALNIGDAGQGINKKDWTAWQMMSVGTTTKSKTFTLDFSIFNPALPGRALKAIRFQVRGKRSNKNGHEKYYDKKDKKYKERDTVTKYDWSAWAEKTMTFQVPNAPNASAEWDDTYVNQTKFSWKTDTSNTGSRIFRRVDWESILVKNSTATSGKKAGKWNSSNLDYRHGTSTDPNSSVTIQEDSTRLADGNSYTRWFRIKARGSRGDSKLIEKSYSKHRYAKPNQSEITTATATKTGAATTKVYVEWTTTTSGGARPVNRTEVEWIMTTPLEDLEPPAGEGWNSVEGAIKDTKGTAACAFVIDGQIAEDQVIFVRVVNYHDNKVTYSVPVIPTGAVGRLKTPSIEDITVEPSTHQAQIDVATECEVPGNQIAVHYKTEGQNDEDSIIIGVFDAPGTYIVQAPDWGEDTPKFGVRGYLGDAEEMDDGDLITYEFPDPLMTSSYSWEGGDIPKAPETVTATPSVSGGEGAITLTWSRTWKEADGSQIAWADHRDAWESTDPPETFDVSGIYSNKWTIAGLETGKTWFVRVRLSKGAGDSKTYGDWSDIIEVSLTTIPNIPALQLSEETITPEGSVQASWAYVSEDGAPQANADLCLATINDEDGGITYDEPFLKVTGAQYVTLDAAALGWEAGGTYNICVRVTSVAGNSSAGWSAPVPVHVALPPTINIVSTSFEDVTITDDEEQEITETVTALTELEFEANVTGAGEGGQTRISMVRAADYFVDRPDEETINGFEGEVVASAEKSGEGQIKIGIENLIGSLDDGAPYILIAEVVDTYGQTASEEIPFFVIWKHQAETPGCDVVMDYDNNAAILTPEAPANYEEGDVCDIYRLSTDKPVLIYRGAEFGETYVDPFPAFGEHGGHRIVTRTANGDYTNDDGIAWLDLRADAGDYIHSIGGVINFDGKAVALMYNVDVSNEWDKEFTETKYLGGSIQGDWTVGVSRKGTITTDLINREDEDQIETWRRLANYAGICHIRTVDGSSFSADVQISENRPHDNSGVYTSFSITFTRVDPEGLDGLTLEEWEQEIG